MNIRRHFTEAWGRFKHDETGAVCVGCGLHVNAGILEVQLCGDGGIKCATSAAPSPTGCKDGLYVDQTLGCGLEKNNGVLEVKAAGQAFNIPTALATAKAACPSPNCNGLVCTDQGLWAPPKLFGSCYEAFDQDPGVASTPMDQYITQPASIADVNGLSDGFPSPSGDFVATHNANFQILFHSSRTPDPSCDLLYFSNTFSTFTISYAVKAGEMWRWLLWERSCGVATAALAGAAATLAASPCVGNNWALQASFYNDRRGQAASIETVQMNDVSTQCEAGYNPYARWEYMITGRRLVGAGAMDNNIIFASRQYRKTISSAHCAVETINSKAAIAP